MTQLNIVTNNPIVFVVTQKTSNFQSNLQKKEHHWRYHPPRHQTILQSYSMILAEKEQHRAVEQNREPRNKLTHLWPINLQQRKQEYTMEKRQSSISGTGKTGQPHVKQ